MGLLRNRMYGDSPSAMSFTRRGRDTEGNFFTDESGLDIRDAVTGFKLQSQFVCFNFGRLVDRRPSKGGWDSSPADLSFAFISLITYDPSKGVQQKPAGWDDGMT